MRFELPIVKSAGKVKKYCDEIIIAKSAFELLDQKYFSRANRNWRIDAV